MIIYIQIIQLKNQLQIREKLELENQQLNTKIFQLQDQLKIKEKLELENQELKEKLDSKSHFEDECLKSLQVLVEMTKKEHESIDEFMKYDKKPMKVCVFYYDVCCVSRVLILWMNISGNILNQAQVWDLLSFELFGCQWKIMALVMYFMMILDLPQCLQWKIKFALK